MNDNSIQIQAVEYYDEFSQHYDKERKEGYFRFITDLEFQKIKPLLNDSYVLEIGCGTGIILNRSNLTAKRAIGVDISNGMVSACKDKGLDALLIDGNNLPFENNYFDLVYSFKVLPHILDIEHLLKEATRVTKPNGRLILEFYNPWSFKGFNDWAKSKFRKKPVYLRHDTLKKFKTYLPKELSIVSTRGIRIFGPIANFYTTPILKNFTRYLDRKCCDLRFIKNFGGYFIIELIHKG